MNKPELLKWSVIHQPQPLHGRLAVAHSQCAIGKAGNRRTKAVLKITAPVFTIRQNRETARFLLGNKLANRLILSLAQLLLTRLATGITLKDFDQLWRAQ